MCASDEMGHRTVNDRNEFRFGGATLDLMINARQVMISIRFRAGASVVPYTKIKNCQMALPPPPTSISTAGRRRTRFQTRAPSTANKRYFITKTTSPIFMGNVILNGPNHPYTVRTRSRLNRKCNEIEKKKRNQKNCLENRKVARVDATQRYTMTIHIL